MRISRKNDHQPAAVVFHALDQSGNGFVSVGILSFANQGVGFVNEQNAVKGFVNGFVGFDGSLPGVFSNQSASVGFNQMSALQNTQMFVDFSNHSRHRGFSSSGVAGEDHVIGDGSGFEPLFFSFQLDSHKVHERFNFLFHRI